MNSYRGCGGAIRPQLKIAGGYSRFLCTNRSAAHMIQAKTARGNPPPVELIQLLPPTNSEQKAEDNGKNIASQSSSSKKQVTCPTEDSTATKKVRRRLDFYSVTPIRTASDFFDSRDVVHDYSELEVINGAKTARAGDWKRKVEDPSSQKASVRSLSQCKKVIIDITNIVSKKSRNRPTTREGSKQRTSPNTQAQVLAERQSHIHSKIKNSSNNNSKGSRPPRPPARNPNNAGKKRHPDIEHIKQFIHLKPSQGGSGRNLSLQGRGSVPATSAPVTVPALAQQKDRHVGLARSFVGRKTSVAAPLVASKSRGGSRDPKPEQKRQDTVRPGGLATTRTLRNVMKAVSLSIRTLGKGKLTLAAKPAEKGGKPSTRQGKLRRRAGEYK